MLKYVVQNWVFLVISVLLASAVVVVQTEVADLRSKLASRDSVVAAQVAKFEKDLVARLNAASKGQAQQNAATKAELQRVPSDGFHKTIPFPSVSPTPLQ